MFRRTFLDSALGALVAVVGFIGQTFVFPVWVYAEEERSVRGSHPNIILILVDDLGWADPGFHGGDARLTPNIDRLARQGLQLNQFCMTPVCATSRSALLTGRYPFRQWMDWRSEDFGKPDYLALLDIPLATLSDGTPTRRIHGLSPAERTLADALKSAGYTTAMIGKWHLGEWLPEHLPLARGFDHQYGHYGWGIDYNSHLIPHNAPQPFCVFDWHRDQQPILETGYSTDLIADEAIRLMKLHEDKDAPFFHYVAFNAIHGPLEEIPRHRDVFDKRSAAIKCLDDAIGRIMETADQLGISDKTLILFTNDNGGLTEEVNSPWRGTKNTTFEGGIRVPCVVRWPGVIAPASVCNELMHVTDIFPTLVAIGGGSSAQTLPLDGLDMSPVIFEGKKSPRNEILIEATGSVRLPSIRSGRWKLIGDALFDLQRDPGERNDVSEANPNTVIELRNRILALSAERPPLGELSHVMNPALPYVYGQAENHSASKRIRSHVEQARRGQQQIWEAGKYPWPAPPQNGQITYEGDGR
ncbi:MAG: arylsulfatase [Pirellulales bacterium]